MQSWRFKTLVWGATDIAITGFGAFEVAQIANPTITTIDVGADKIGQQAGAIITSLADSRGKERPAAFVDLPPRLILGGSS